MRKLCLVLVLLVVLSLSCNTLTTGLRSQSILWMDTFHSEEGWRLSVDESVGCPQVPYQPGDIKMSFQDDVLLLESNVQERPGFFGNAIASRPFKFEDDRQYMLTGSFKIPSGAELELANAALEFVVDGVGHYAEIIYGRNPWTPEYGWIYTRGTDLKHIQLFNIGIDDEWHDFTLIATVNTATNKYEITSIGIDGEVKDVNVDMTSFPKPWSSSTQVYLETHNMYPNCGSDYVSYGASMWDNIVISTIP